MGRPSTGAWSVYESLRIELPYLLKHGHIQKGSICSFSLTWTNQHGNKTGMASFVSSYLDSQAEKYLQLYYTITKSDGTKTDYNYKAYFFEQPSNLGKGNILYFLCPQSGLKCRILYKAYGSPIFKSREAYQHRLYYECQQSSKLNIYNDMYWRLDKQLDKIRKETCRGERTYKGLLTKKAQRYNRLYLKKWKMDELRWTLGVPKALRGKLGDIF